MGVCRFEREAVRTLMYGMLFLQVVVGVFAVMLRGPAFLMSGGAQRAVVADVNAALLFVACRLASCDEREGFFVRLVALVFLSWGVVLMVR